MDAHIVAMEKANETVRVQINQLRVARQRLLEGAYQFRRTHLPAYEGLEPSLPPLAASLDGDVGQALVAAIRTYYVQKKRGPRDVHDLSDHLSKDVLEQVARTHGLYESARRHVTQANYAAGAKKRKGGAGADGAGADEAGAA